jgi:hypothetical protein
METGEIHILPTDTAPEFIFNSEGMFKIRGRGLYSSCSEVSAEVDNWIDKYLVEPAEITYVLISLEYLNSFSTTILVSILRKLNRVVLQSKKLVIQWYYEEDDEDMLERGEYISMTFDIPIIFIEADHLTDY